MSLELLKKNIEHMKEITRELYVFTNQLEVIKNLETSKTVVINTEEKRLLNEAIRGLTNQLKIINNSLPELVEKIGFYKKLVKEDESKPRKKEKLVQVSYKSDDKKKEVALAIGDKDRKNFLENLSRTNLSINKLKRNYSVERVLPEFGKPNSYAKISNHFFRKTANKLVSGGYFNSLNRNLRKINSPFVLGTYVAMMIFTVVLSFFASFLLFLVLLFFKISLFPLGISLIDSSIFLRFFQVFWIIFVIPLSIGTIFYFYPSSEAKNIGKKIDRELPFVTIHMSAISTSGVDPVSIFKIVLRGEEYKYTKVELRKLMNLINFHGKDLVTALKQTARSCPSSKLKELLNGLSTAITSGGSIHNFLDEHSEGLLFDYRMSREKQIKTSETFMDIYISVVIAAPMILLILFVIMGSTGTLNNFLGIPASMLGFLIIFAIIIINIFFLVFLKLKHEII